MAHIWYRDSENGWTALALDGRVVELTDCPPRVLAAAPDSGEVARAILMLARGGAGTAWVLLAREGVRVNGLQPVAGMHVLRDRDEIVVDANTEMFFSAETLAHIEGFPGAPQPVYCGRCRQVLTMGQPGVRCPQCGLWHHQTAELPCWTYAETCGLCPQRTALDAGFAWVPEA
jgi:hypothetical protein